MCALHFNIEDKNYCIYELSNGYSYKFISLKIIR